ncbi:SLC13 family permease [Gordonia aquimaris]|uniref:SLC13 family permease n=1 Tax=Gordonia aquimaris TaxID=2984863 RepID=A0A9X3I3I6_9ACTN|nr:SLC13 family permease [Gordonia aquimaris]MCX2963206.1 SLC13 family permease [Gordonia aquimaris]
MQTHMHIIGVLVLAGILVLGTVRPINLGALSLVAAFIVGTVGFGSTVPEILEPFPANLFVMLVGITYLFSVARASGTVDWMVEGAVRLTGNRAHVIPWVLFVLGLIICSIGAFSPAVAAMLAPIAMSFAVKYRLDPLLSSIVIGLGCIAGSFSPIAPLGLIVNSVGERSGIEVNPTVLYLGVLAMTTLVAVGTAVVLRLAHRSNASDDGDLSGEERFPVVGNSRPSGPGAMAAPTEVHRPGVENYVTLAGFVVLAIGGLVIGWDIGFLALTIAVVLTLVFPGSSKNAMSEISWGVILLICGVLTYVGLLEENGTVEWAGAKVATAGAPMITALLILVVAAVASAAASTTGLLGMIVPLAVPFLATGHVSVVGFLIALAISSSLVDLSPFSTGGAIYLANAPERWRPSLYRGLLKFTGAMVIVGPLVSWLLLVVPNWV